MSLARRRSASDAERFLCGVDGSRREVRLHVYLEDAIDLRDESVSESKVAAGCANDGGKRSGVGEPRVVRIWWGKLLRGDCGELVAAQWPVFVREADSAVELRVAGEAFLDAGHADQDDAHLLAVVEVADLFETGRYESVGFVVCKHSWGLDRRSRPRTHTAAPMPRLQQC